MLYVAASLEFVLLFLGVVGVLYTVNLLGLKRKKSVSPAVGSSDCLCSGFLASNCCF